MRIFSSIGVPSSLAIGSYHVASESGWNLKTLELKSTLTGHTDSVIPVAISPDGKILVSGSRDKTVKIWNLETLELKSTLPSERYANTGHSYWVLSVAISPDSKTLMSGSRDKTIKIWRIL